MRSQQAGFHFHVVGPSFSSAIPSGVKYFQNSGDIVVFFSKFYKSMMRNNLRNTTTQLFI